jgi:tetratricopeptide (TPR) repeat protein
MEFRILGPLEVCAAGGLVRLPGAKERALGGLVAVQGDEPRAVALLAEAAAISRRAGDQRGIAYAWNALGAIARARGDLERARELHRQALDIVREIVGWSVPHTLAQLGCAEARLGELDHADSHLREAAELALNAYEPATAALILVGQALAALGREQPERAALLLGAADAVREQTGIAPVGAAQIEADTAHRAVQDQLGPDTGRSALAAGRELGAAALRPNYFDLKK